MSASADSLRTLADSNPDTPLEDPIVAADVAAIRTARIVAMPDSIVLIIGQPVLLFERYRVLAYDGAGNALAGFVPFVETEDRSLMRRDGPRTIGVKEGVTRLRITPMFFHPEYRGSTAEAFVRVYVRAR